MQVLPLLLSLLNALDTVYKGVIGILWNAAVTFGLSPKYAFLIPFTSYSSFQNLGMYISGALFYQIAALVMLISSAATLAYNSFGEPRPYITYIARIATSVIIGSVSFLFMVWILKSLDHIYSTVYGGAGVNWSNFLLFSSNIFQASAHPVSNGDYAALIELFTLTGYFTAVVSLFAELMLRQALMLLALLILPLGTVLYAFDRGRRFATVLWEILVEMSAFPFLVLLCLYLANIFAWDTPLQLAFLFLPSLIPGIFFATGNSFLSAPIMGFLGGMSLTRTMGKGVEAGSIIGGIANGTGAADSLKRGAMFPVTERNPLTKNFQATGNRDEMPWRDMLKDELKKRKE